MNTTLRLGIPAVALALSVALTSTAATQEIEEAPSTVNAVYVAESPTVALRPREKIENLFTKNATQSYVLQKLTDRVYFFQSQYYGTIFYVGNEGVLLFDALEGRAEAINAAIDSVTDLPIRAILYSHNHADHIADASIFARQIPNLHIVATQATASLMERLGSRHPKPSDVIDPRRNRFTFEGLTVRVVPLEFSGHAHDHSVYVLEGTGVIHVPDVINPDQPPFWAFAGAESYLGYRDMINTIGSLEWNYLSGGHGNVGSHDDVDFYMTFLDDLEAAVGEALGNVPWGSGIENPEELNAHTAYLSSWIRELGIYATNVLRPKYGDYYGFEYATPKNAELVSWVMFEYR